MDEEAFAVVVAGELIVFRVCVQGYCFEAERGAFVYNGFKQVRAYARVVDFGVYAE